MRVLVTGGAGFIGSHVAESLLQQGHEVSIIDNLSTGKAANLPEAARFQEMDIRSDAIHDLWARERWEVMFHLAAQMNVRKSVEDPSFDADVNLRGLLNLMEAGRRNGLGRVVFTSTGGAAYDDNGPFPTPETTPAQPVSPYGIAKIASELYLRYYMLEYGIPYVALRLGNVYGPRQNPHGEAGVVAIFMQRLLAGEVAYINGDGLQTRDYVYVGEVVRAVLLALEKGDGESINIGTGVETNVVQLYDQVREALGVALDAVHRDALGGEVRRSCLDAGKAERILGWKSETSFAQGLSRTAHDFRTRP